MNNFMNKMNRFMRKGNLYLVLVCILVVAVVIIGLYFALFSKNPVSAPPANPGQTTADGNKLLVKNLSGGEEEEIEIPKYSLAQSNYDAAKFIAEGSFTTYDGAYVGIDVSEHQGTIDWAAVKASGVDFAFIRSAFRGNTRGDIYADTNFDTNMQGAIDNGIKVGVYFFSQATTEGEANEEAGYVLNQIAPYKDKIDYPIAFDWERATDAAARTAATKGEEMTTFAKAFCTKISKAGYKPMVYMNKSMAYGEYNLDALKDYPIWIAEYESRPSFYYDFTVWQYADNATVSGIPDNTVDVNISFKDYSK